MVKSWICFTIIIDSKFTYGQWRLTASWISGSTRKVTWLPTIMRQNTKQNLFFLFFLLYLFTSNNIYYFILKKLGPSFSYDPTLNHCDRVQWGYLIFAFITFFFFFFKGQTLGYSCFFPNIMESLSIWNKNRGGEDWSMGERAYARKLSIPKIDICEIKKQSSSSLMSPTSQSCSSKLQVSSTRGNCLCSPTTHVGSFRCRHHRTQSQTRLASSTSLSNLSELSSKPDTMTDTIEAQ